jgi:hypothetical protein
MKTAITSLFLVMLLSSCSTSTSLKEDCIKTVATYGDAIECMIKLNNLQQ